MGSEGPAAAVKTSQYHGVEWDPSAEAWSASVVVDEQRKHLGTFPDEYSAAKAHDEFVRACSTGHALSFPGDASDEPSRRSGSPPRPEPQPADAMTTVREVLGGLSATTTVGERLRALPSATQSSSSAPATSATANENAGAQESSVTTRGCFYKGVTRNKSFLRPWQAYLSLLGSQLRLGSFKTAEEAARAHDRYLVDPVANFQPDGSLNPHRNMWSWTQRLIRPEMKEELERLLKCQRRPRRSIYKGVRQWPPKRKWRSTRLWEAHISLLSSSLCVGSYEKAEEAARAYDRYLTEPVLNFLEDGSLNPHRRMKTGKNRVRPEMMEELEQLLRPKRSRKGDASATETARAAVADGIGPRGPADVMAGGAGDEAQGEGGHQQQNEERGEAAAAEGEVHGEGMEIEVGAQEEEGKEGEEEEGKGRAEEEEEDGGGEERIDVETMEIDVGGEDEEGEEGEEEGDDDDNEEVEEEREQEGGGGVRVVIDLTEDDSDEDEDAVGTTTLAEQPSSSSFFSTSGGGASSTPTTATTSVQQVPESDSSSSSEARGAEVDEVWLQLKAAVFSKLMTMDGRAGVILKYLNLSSLLNKPTRSMRGFVEGVMMRSGFKADAADRAVEVLADMAARGDFSD